MVLDLQVLDLEKSVVRRTNSNPPQDCTKLEHGCRDPFQEPSRACRAISGPYWAILEQRCGEIVMLVCLLSLAWGCRTVMFQLSGFDWNLRVLKLWCP